jgi:hypothetical protein
MQDAIKLFNTVRNIVRKMLKKTKFCYCVQGRIAVDNSNGTYEVVIDNETSTIKSMHNYTYSVNDIVWIMIINNNYSDKQILTKC